jgi:hypothetical protein
LGGGEGERCGSGSGLSSFFFFPPITPRPPFAFFEGAFGWDDGVAICGGGELLGVRLCRGAATGFGSRSGSDSDAVASSALDAAGGGERLVFFVFRVGGDIFGLTS